MITGGPEGGPGPVQPPQGGGQTQRGAQEGGRGQVVFFLSKGKIWPDAKYTGRFIPLLPDIRLDPS